MKRLIISLLIVVVLATVGFGWTLDKLFSQVNSNAGSILSTFQNHGHQLASLVDTDDPETTLQSVASIPGADLVIQDLESIALPDNLQNLILAGEPLALESAEGVTLYYFLKRSGKVLSYLPPALRQLQRQNRQRIYFTILFYTGLISLTLLWLYPLVKRLLNLSKVAREFGAGNLDARVRPAKRSYIADIEADFNRMAGQIETLISDNKLLTSAVSHDLRTPIARLRFGIDAVMETDNEADKSRYLKRISDDLTTMEELVEVMLGYAHMEQQMSQTHHQKLDVGDALSRAVGHNDIEATEIHWNPPTTKYLVEANEHYLGMLLNNILGNAIKYGSGDVWVSVHANKTTSSSKTASKSVAKKTHGSGPRAASGTVTVTIEDNGPGIPADQRTRVVRPFERNSTEKKGHGMGLAVVSRIVESLGAELTIADSESHRGAAVSVTFSLVPPESTKGLV